MRIKTILLMIFVVSTIFVMGCMREKEICNYDGICSDEETDNCADCKNVLGRDVPEPVFPEDENIEPPLGGNQ